MASTPTPHEDSEEGREFLQRRVAAAGLFGGAVGVAFLAFRAVEAAIKGDYGELLDPSYWFHVGGTFSMLLMWGVCRHGQRSIALIRTAETLAIVVSATCYSLMGMYVATWQMPHQIVLLAMLSMLVARAVYVPSSARRTFLLTSACGVPILIATYLMFHNLDADDWNHVDPEERRATVWLGTGAATAFAAAWWSVAVALSTAASMVIYGLRRSVRSARRLGQYELLEKLGEGGMGVVYRAEHAMLRRPTAVKLLPPDKVGARALARFEKEVQQTARLTHPNTVTIFDYGRTPTGIFYYAMELLEGATLAQVVDVGGVLPAGRVARIIEQVARALSEAHDIGLIHRDIKPANIMLVCQGNELDVAKVLDFGLVKELNRDVGESLTQADSITGTPQYLSPEGITEPTTVDARSDIYALGAVAYYLLCAEHVFTGRSVVEICSKHLYESPLDIASRSSGVPPALADIVMRCLAKDPGQRPQTALALATEIRACARGVTAWTEADAARWWERFGSALSTRATRTIGTSGPRTMEVDVLGRTHPRERANLGQG